MYDEAKKKVFTDEEKALWQQEFNNTAVKLKGQEARLKDFCNQTGRYLDTNRTQVFAVATENGIKNYGRSVSQKAVWANKKTVDKTAKSGIMNMGGMQMNKGGILDLGALNPEKEEDYIRARDHAFKYYDEIRHRKSDVSTIAKNIGWKESAISKVKNHLFINKYDLGGDELERFYPSYDIAVSWQNLIDGKDIQDKDIILLKHEYLELTIMDVKGLNYKEAHKIAENKHNYKRAVDNWRNSQ